MDRQLRYRNTVRRDNKVPRPSPLSTKFKIHNQACVPHGSLMDGEMYPTWLRRANGPLLLLRSALEDCVRHSQTVTTLPIQTATRTAVTSFVITLSCVCAIGLLLTVETDRLCGVVVKSSWLQNGNVLCFLWGTNWIYIHVMQKKVYRLCGLVVRVPGSQMVVRLSSLCTGRALFSRNIFLLLVLISVRGWINPKA
jgi:hypothetical protein